MEALDAILRNHHDFAIFDFADELRSDDVKGAGFRAENVGVVQLAEDQWADAEGIAGADQFIVGERHQGIGAFQGAERIDVAFDNTVLLRPCNQMQNHFGIGGRLADAALGDELLAQRQTVGYIAIVGDREATHSQLGE